MKKPILAASLICCDPLNIEKDISELLKGEIDWIHFDVMDGQFVPRYGLYVEVLTSLSIDSLRRAENPPPNKIIFGLSISNSNSSCHCF